MKKYERILVAVELNPESDKKLLEAAKEMAGRDGAELSLLHVVEHIGSFDGMYGITIPAALEDEIVKEAKAKLVQMGVAFGIPVERQMVDLEMEKGAIAQKAGELGMDLIVVGSHGRHGLDRLMGSTANAVLHRAKCDVLVVRTAA